MCFLSLAKEYCMIRIVDLEFYYECMLFWSCSFFCERFSLDWLWCRNSGAVECFAGMLSIVIQV